MLITNPPALNFSGVSTFNLSTTNSYTYPKNATCCLIIHQLKQYKTKGDNVPRVDLFQNNSPERSGGYNKKLLKYLSSDGSLPLEKFPLQEASKKLFLNREIYFDKSCLNDLIDQLGKTLSAYKINGDNISQLTNNELSERIGETLSKSVNYSEEFIEKNQQLFRITLEKITDDNKFNLIESYKNSYVLKIDGSYKQIAAIEDEIKPKWLIGSNKRKKDKAFDTFKLLDNKIPTLSDKKVNAEHWKANKLTEPVT